MTPNSSRMSGVPIVNNELSPLQEQNAIYSEVTEDPGGYLEPVSLCNKDSGVDCMDGDFSYMEGSVCDSNYFENMATPTSRLNTNAPPPINVEKYKIQRNANESSGKALAPIAQESEEEEEEDGDDAVFSEETLRRVAEKERMIREYEDNGILPKSDSEQSLPCLKDDQSISSQDDDGGGSHGNSLKRISSDSGNIDTASLNDLNKSDSQNDLRLSEPNISGCTLDKNTNVPDDYAIDKLKKALSNSNDGLVTLYHGKTEDNRLSQDTQNALNQHQLRLHSSDC